MDSPITYQPPSFIIPDDGLATDVDDICCTIVDRGENWSVSWQVKFGGTDMTFKRVEELMAGIAHVIKAYLDEEGLSWEDGDDAAGPDA